MFVETLPDLGIDCISEPSSDWISTHLSTSILNWDCVWVFDWVSTSICGWEWEHIVENVTGYKADCNNAINLRKGGLL